MGEVDGVQSLPSAVESGMDFGRCHSCGRIRWLTQAALAQERGTFCDGCGAKVVCDAWKIRLTDRIPLFLWFFWEVGQLNGKGWWRNPINLAIAVWAAATPKLDYYSQKSDPPKEMVNESN